MNYFLGVDGGASKTAALVTDESGKSLGTGVAGPSNHLRVGIETAARNIERAVNKALVAADVASREIAWAYCGIAGADHPAHRQEVVDSLEIFFPRGNFTVDNDARIALTGAIGFGAGVVVIAGTGSAPLGPADAARRRRGALREARLRRRRSRRRRGALDRRPRRAATGLVHPRGRAAAAHHRRRVPGRLRRRRLQSRRGPARAA